MDEEVLGDGTADVMARHGDRPGDLQRGRESCHPVRKGRDRCRFQGASLPSAPVRGDRPPRAAAPPQRGGPSPGTSSAPIRSVQEQHGRAVLLHGQVAGRRPSTWTRSAARWIRWFRSWAHCGRDLSPGRESGKTLRYIPAMTLIVWWPCSCPPAVDLRAGLRRRGLRHRPAGRAHPLRLPGLRRDAPARCRPRPATRCSSTRGLAALERADTVVVPGWQPAGRARAAECRGAAGAHGRGARIVAICSGASCWPRPDCSTAAAPPPTGAAPPRSPPPSPRCGWIRTCSTWTTATWRPAPAPARASTCACTWSVPTTARAYAAHIARHMVMPPHREGGHSSTPRSRPARADDSLAPLLEWAAAPRHPLTVDDLAEQAGLSPGPSPAASPTSSAPARAVAAGRAVARHGRCWRRPTCRWRRSPRGSDWPRRSTCAAASDAHLGTTPGAYRRTFSET